MGKGKVVVIVRCSIRDKVYGGKREVKLYSGDNQKTTDANTGLVVRVKKEIKSALYQKYEARFEAQDKAKSIAGAKLLQELQKSSSAYYKIERWVCGENRGMVKTFDKKDIKKVIAWYKDNVDNDSALVTLLTDGNREVEVKLFD